MGNDPVNNPAHYAQTVKPIDAIEAWSPFWPSYIAGHLFNVVKYVARAGLKGNLLQDLEKAQWYLERAIVLVNVRKSKDAKDSLEAVAQTMARDARKTFEEMGQDLK